MIEGDSLKALRETLEKGAKELVGIMSPHMNMTNAKHSSVYVTVEDDKGGKYLVGFTVEKK